VGRYRLEPATAEIRGSGAAGPSMSLRPSHPAGRRAAGRARVGPQALEATLPVSEHDLVFPDAKGRPMQSSDLLRTGLHAALRRAGLRR